jgi:enoyl-CoA hydratase/carnithine racemase
MIASKGLDGAVAVFTLSRPPVNAISERWLASFEGALAQLTKSGCRVLHIRSDQKVFCAGADLDEISRRMTQADGADRMYAYAARIQRLYARIERLPQVTIAEIGGAAMGGGLELALACDLRIAASEAKLGLPEARLGLIPGAGGTQRLARLCGPAVAARLILGAEIVDGAAAHELGIVQWAVSRERLEERATEIAGGIAELPAAALAECKACIAVAERFARDGYADELEATRRLFTNDDTRQRVQAFLAKPADRTARSKREKEAAP